jgi:hypothetical protein
MGHARNPGCGSGRPSGQKDTARRPVASAGAEAFLETVALQASTLQDLWPGREGDSLPARRLHFSSVAYHSVHILREATAVVRCQRAAVLLLVARHGL